MFVNVDPPLAAHDTHRAAQEKTATERTKASTATPTATGLSPRGKPFVGVHPRFSSSVATVASSRIAAH